MSGLENLSDTAAKIILIGENGSGKSGAIMSLLCAGYKVRMIDTDNGARTLKGLFNSNDYPYQKYLKSKDINITEAFSSISFSIPMAFRRVTYKVGSETKINNVLAPKHADTWQEIIDTLANWKDPETNINNGNFTDWDNSYVLVTDSFTTISQMAYYAAQQLHNRLGALEEGYTHQQDVGTAQNQLRRFLEFIFGANVKCNLVFICHINSIDPSRGYDQTTSVRHQNDPGAIIEAKGYPLSVGVKLSKRVGLFACDSFVVKQTGSGKNVKRIISTIPTSVDGVEISTKTSAFLAPEYSVTTGLAEIFAALRGQPAPTELITALGGVTTSSNNTNNFTPIPGKK